MVHAGYGIDSRLRLRSTIDPIDEVQCCLCDAAAVSSELQQHVLMYRYRIADPGQRS